MVDLRPVRQSSEKPRRHKGGRRGDRLEVFREILRSIDRRPNLYESLEDDHRRKSSARKAARLKLAIVICALALLLGLAIATVWHQTR